MDTEMSEAAGTPAPSQQAGEQAGGAERVYPNIKYRQRHVPFAVLTWLVLYFAPGILIGQWTTPAAGLLWMCVGALLAGAFMWRCFFPQRLAAHRDGFRVERPDRKRGVAVEIGYGKIHEAQWRHAAASWRRVLGPLVFIEPLWPAQRAGNMKLVVKHAGPEMIFREDEIGRLEEFVEMLRTRNVMGLERRRTSAPPSFFRQ